MGGRGETRSERRQRTRKVRVFCWDEHRLSATGQSFPVAPNAHFSLELTVGSCQTPNYQFWSLAGRPFGVAFAFCGRFSSMLLSMGEDAMLRNIGRQSPVIVPHRGLKPSPSGEGKGR